MMSILFKRVFGCVLILICFCSALGCKTGGLLQKERDKNPTLATAKLKGEKTTLSIDLPFEVTSAPKDESNLIPPELEGIILKVNTYQASSDKIALNVSNNVFNEEIVNALTEQDLREALNEELNENISEIRNNSDFSNLKTSHRETKISGNPAIIAVFTYDVKKKNHLKSTLVYIFNSSEMWRIIFDYGQSDETAASIVDSSVKSIRF